MCWCEEDASSDFMAAVPVLLVAPSTMIGVAGISIFSGLSILSGLWDGWCTSGVVDKKGWSTDGVAGVGERAVAASGTVE